jgi:hypothetical protein
MARRTKPAKSEWRYGATTVALALLLFALSIDTPGTLARSAYAMLGSAGVGMYAAVDPNPDNTLAAQFAQKEAQLNARAAVLGAQEGGSLTGTRMLAAGSFVVSVLVLLLVALNFFMDWRRNRTVASARA